MTIKMTKTRDYKLFGLPLKQRGITAQDGEIIIFLIIKGQLRIVTLFSTLVIGGAREPCNIFSLFSYRDNVEFDNAPVEC